MTIHDNVAFHSVVVEHSEQIFYQALREAPVGLVRMLPQPPVHGEDVEERCVGKHGQGVDYEDGLGVP